MFQHLDDHATDVDLDRFRVDVDRRAVALQRRRRVAATTGFAAVLVPLLIGYTVWRGVQPTRVHVFDDLPTTQPATTIAASDTSVAPAATVSSPPAEGALITLLVVGTDRGLTEDQTSVRADTILVVRLDPTGHRRVLTIPRDLKVTDERTGTDVRINSLLTDRPALVRAVSAVAGTTIDHYVEIDTTAFASLVDAIGGVDLPFDAPVRDSHSGFAAEAGCQHLDGDQMRAYVRSRYLEVFRDGVWQGDPSSDYGRIARLQDLAQRVVPRVLDGDGIGLDELVGSILPRLTVDDRLSLGEARHVLSVARQLRGAGLDWAVVPTRPVQVDNTLMLETTDTATAPAFLVRGVTASTQDTSTAAVSPLLPSVEACAP